MWLGDLAGRLLNRPGTCEAKGRELAPVAAGSRAGRWTAPPPVMTGYLENRDDRSRWSRAARYGVTFAAIVFYSFFILLLPVQVMLPFLLPIFILYGFMLWSMPVTNRPPPKIMTTLFWLHMGSLFLWPNYLALTIPGLPWITAARLFGAPLVLLVIWSAFTSAPFKAEIAKARSAMPFLIGGMVAFSVLQVISIGFSDALFITVNRVVNNLMTWTAIFFASIWVFREIGKLRLWIVAYVVMTGILCLMAIVEARNAGVLWAHSVPSFLRPPDPIVDDILDGSYRLTGQYRVQTTQTTPLSLAEMISMAIPLMFYLVCRVQKIWIILLMVFLDVAIMYTLAMADARLGFISLIIGHMLCLLYFGWTRWRDLRGSLLGAAITLMYPAMAVALTVVVLGIQSIRTRVIGSGQHQGSNQAREDQWRMGLDEIWSSPIFGFGADRGGEKVGYYSPSGQLTVDSYYLNILMDYGIVGFLLFISIFVYAVWKGYSFERISNRDQAVMLTSLVVLILQFLVIKMVLSQPANHPLAFMALGGIVALAAATNRNGNHSKVCTRAKR